MAKVTRKALREQVKKLYLDKVADCLMSYDEEVLIVGSNKLAIPVVDAEGNEDFVTITISIPTGSREDNCPYDGYGEAESYKLKCKEKARKEEEKAKKKAEKIKRDEEFRRKKAEQKAKAEGRT